MIKYLDKASRKALSGVAIVRLDFNTTDDWRMRASVPTLQLLQKNASKILIVSHFGRPDPQKPFEKKLSLRKHGITLSKFLKKKIIFIDHFRFDEIKKTIESAPRGSVFLLENIRSLKGETENDPGLARKLASLGDFFVNDCFAVSHRANASFTAITKFLP